MNGIHVNSMRPNVLYEIIFWSTYPSVRCNKDYYRRYYVKPIALNFLWLASRASIFGVCRDYPDSRISSRADFSLGVQTPVYVASGEKNRRRRRPRKLPSNAFLLPRGSCNLISDEGKVRDFWHTAYISSAYLPGCRDTTRLITDKDFLPRSQTRYCSTEMAFLSDGTTPLSTAVNMSDLTGGVRNSARISYYPKIVSEL